MVLFPTPREKAAALEGRVAGQCGRRQDGEKGAVRNRRFNCLKYFKSFNIFVPTHPWGWRNRVPVFTECQLREIPSVPATMCPPMRGADT